MLLALAREGHRVTLVSFAGPEDSPHLPLAEHCCERVITVPEPRPQMPGDLLSRLCAAATATPFGVKRFSQPQMAAALLTELRRDTFDVVICDDIYMFGNLPAHTDAPILLNKHDLTYEIMERYAAYESNPVKRAYLCLEARNVKHWEVRVCDAARRRARLLGARPAHHSGALSEDDRMRDPQCDRRRAIPTSNPGQRTRR